MPTEDMVLNVTVAPDRKAVIALHSGFNPHGLVGHSKASPPAAHVPGGGHMWDLAKNKGPTYRSYGEYASRARGLLGHVSAKFKLPGMRDTDNAKVLLAELDEYEKHFGDANPVQRLPNFMVMSLPENHTAGTTPGRYSPISMVANGDYAVGMIVDRLTHSPLLAGTGDLHH